MSSKKKESTPAPAYVQDPALTALLKTQAENATTQSNLSTGLYKDESNLVGGLLRGEQPGGIYSNLGQGYGAGVEEAMFDRNRSNAYSSLANAGLMDAGIRAELEGQAATDVSIASADRSRDDLLQLMNMAMGGAGTMYGTANQSAGTGISGLSSRESNQNNYAQQNYQSQLNADAQRRAQNAQLWSSLLSGVGGLSAGLLSSGLFSGGSSGGATGSAFSTNPNYQLVNGRVTYTGS
jgi:hypothetical protein